MEPQIWLMKSEPEVYSIENLKRDKKTWWEGVRNYQARNFMTQKMKVGDLILFYHSNAEPSGVAGLARVCGEASPDKTQFDKASEYFDPKSTPQKPNWFCVQVKFEKVFPSFVPLTTLKTDPRLQELLVIKRGQRLSIQPVRLSEAQHICRLGGLEDLR
jgi:predicted RNA-binding protein with PUA-like domain